MKAGRQNMILKVIDENNVETQDDLAAKLKKEGFEVTQATISRDIKELKLIKVQSGGGSYKYASSGVEQTGKLDVFRRVFRRQPLGLVGSRFILRSRIRKGGRNIHLDAPACFSELKGIGEKVVHNFFYF